jgi:hypothetical protein
MIDDFKADSPNSGGRAGQPLRMRVNLQEASADVNTNLHENARLYARIYRKLRVPFLTFL